MRKIIKKYPGLVIFFEIAVIITVIFAAYMIKYHKKNAKQQDYYEAIKEEAWSNLNNNADNKRNASDKDSSLGKKDFSEKKELPSDFPGVITIDAYKNINSDVIAYIFIPDTQIDYPILKKEDSDNYYLKHNIDNSTGYPGCIYVENYVNSDFNDLITVVYGHNMKNGTMFGSLHKMHRDHEFLESHKKIYLYTSDSIKVYSIVCCSYYSDEHVLSQSLEKGSDNLYVFKGFTENAGKELLEKIKAFGDEKAYFSNEKITENDELLVLSTCNTNSTRVVAVAKEIGDYLISEIR